MNYRLISKKSSDVINILLIVIFFILSCDSTESVQPLEQKKVDPFIQNKKIAKTINLGNALDAPNEGEWGVTLEAEYFQIIKSAGFSGIRLPIRWSNHTQANAPFTIDENFFKNLYFGAASGEKLPFKDNTFDAIFVGFGIRNFTNIKVGLEEMRRCLKDNGNLIILEFSSPQSGIFQNIYDWYSFKILPKIGKLVANDENSYKYLVESIRMHPNQEKLKSMIIDSGYKKCKFFICNEKFAFCFF